MAGSRGSLLLLGVVPDASHVRQDGGVSRGPVAPSPGEFFAILEADRAIAAILARSLWPLGTPISR